MRMVGSFQRTLDITTSNLSDLLTLRMHYHFTNIENADLDFFVIDGVGLSGMYESRLLKLYWPSDLPQLESLKVFVPKQSREDILYNWKLLPHPEQVELYGT